MGAWGTGPFEDDGALDFVWSIEDAGNPKGIINTALEIAIDSEYLGVDDANAAIISAVYIDHQLNGTTFSPSQIDEPYPVDTFSERHPDLELSDLRQKAIEALTIVLGEQSELNELWTENGEDYEEWRSGIEVLIERLER